MAETNANNPLAVPQAATGQHGLASYSSVTNLLVGIDVAVFVAMVMSGVSLVHPTTGQLIRWGANYGPLSLGPQPWRILTSNYVHIGILHIFFNMWCLWSLGKLAERIFSPATYFLLYTFCGITGSLASLWWHPQVVGAGASGAIFGIAGALIAVFYLGHLPIPQAAVKSTLRSLLTFAGYNLFFGLAGGIDNVAHLGGLTAGLAFGAVVSKHILAPPEVRRKWLRYASLGMIVVLLMAGSYLRKSYAKTQATTQAQIAVSAASRQAVTAFQRGDYDEAINQLQTLIQQDPSEVHAHYLLGLAYLGKHEDDAAIAAFQDALRLKPDYAEAEEGVAAAYEDKGMQQQADEAHDRAAQMAKGQHQR